MRTRSLVIFLTVIITIYSLANIYLFKKVHTELSVMIGNFTFTIIFFLFSVTFIAGKIFERASSSVIVDILNVIGGFWLAIMLYGSLFFFITDIVQFTGKIFGLINSENVRSFRHYSFLLVTGITAIAIITGFFNSVLPISKEYQITINKKFDSKKKIRIAAVSDVHLGSIVRNRSLRKLSQMLDKAKPDIIFFLGDLVDGEINPVLRDDLLKSLKLPECATDVYAITGNHEYIGGASKTIPYLKSHGLEVLLDEVVTLSSGIQVIGRKDKDSWRILGEKRVELSELIQKCDPLKPIIVLDHQPFSKKYTTDEDFDLMLSGHTHNGQMWPFNYIVKMIFKEIYGSFKTGNNYYIISSGFGTWGPRIRLGSRSEIVIVDLISGEM